VSYRQKLPPAHSVTVYRGDYSGAIGQVSEYSSSSVTWQNNGIGTGTIIADEDVKVPEPVDALGQNLTRVVPVVVRDGGRIWTGRVAHAERVGRPGKGTVTASLVDDWVWVSAMLAWPVPTAALNAQTSVHDIRTGPVETAVKGYLSVAITRLGVPCAVVPAPAVDTSPSDYPTPKARFDPLDEVLLPMLAATGRRLTAQLWLPGWPQARGLLLSRPTIVFDVATPSPADHVIWTDELGIVTRRLSTTSPTATDAVIGMKGEDLERAFTSARDEALITQLGDYRLPELMVDATDVDTAVEGQARGLAKLGEYRGKASVAFTVDDGVPYTFGSDYDVGSVVRARTSGIPITDAVDRVTSSDNRSDGRRITPQVGASSVDESTEKLVINQVAELATAIARNNSRR